MDIKTEVSESETRAEQDGSGQEIAAAFFPAKEEWKKQPGNRYTPQEIEAMVLHWSFRKSLPRCFSRRAD
jgi:hypothetical protein